MQTPLVILIQDENGKVKPRLVNIESDLARLCFKNLDYLEDMDLADAKKYLENPEDYLFTSILNWPEIR